MSSVVIGRAAAERVVNQPANLVFTAGFYLMVTALLSGLWYRAAQDNGGAVVGYSAAALVWYIAMSEASIMALPQRLIAEVGDDIVAGRIEIEMLRPTSVLGARLAAELGQVLPRLGVIIALGLAYAGIVGGAPPRVAALALAAPALLLAVTLNLVTQHVVAGAAFWVRDAKSAWFLYQKVVFVLGGMLLPLEVLPSGLETIARFLPFSAMAYVPARLASGHFEPVLLAVQAGWIVVMGIAAVRVFAAGERRVLEALV